MWPDQVLIPGPLTYESGAIQRTKISVQCIVKIVDSY